MKVNNAAFFVILVGSLIIDAIIFIAFLVAVAHYVSS